MTEGGKFWRLKHDTKGSMTLLLTPSATPLLPITEKINSFSLFSCGATMIQFSGILCKEKEHPCETRELKNRNLSKSKYCKNSLHG